MGNHAKPPACWRTGAHCLELTVTLRVASYHDGPYSGDDEATWLLGHTERLTVQRIWRKRGYLMADVVLAIPCRYLEQVGENGLAHEIRCRVHPLKGTVPRSRHAPKSRRLSSGKFEYVRRRRLVAGELPLAAPGRRALPVVAANPCATARCRTADQTVGSACCRDLQIEIVCSKKAVHLESLVRHRKSPYLCKVERETKDTIGAEIISACSYLEPGVGCSLHDRRRPGGAAAKPDLCYEWPKGSEVFHTDCVFRA